MATVAVLVACGSDSVSSNRPQSTVPSTSVEGEAGIYSYRAVIQPDGDGLCLDVTTDPPVTIVVDLRRGRSAAAASRTGDTQGRCIAQQLDVDPTSVTFQPVCDDPSADAEVLFNTAGWTYVHLRRSHGWTVKRARAQVTRITTAAFMPSR